MRIDDPQRVWVPSGTPIDWKAYGFVSPTQQREAIEAASRHEGAMNVARNLGLLRQPSVSSPPDGDAVGGERLTCDVHGRVHCATCDPVGVKLRVVR